MCLARTCMRANIQTHMPSFLHQFLCYSCATTYASPTNILSKVFRSIHVIIIGHWVCRTYLYVGSHPNNVCASISQNMVLFISTLISLSAPLLYAVFDSYHRPPSLNGCLLLRHKQLVLLQTIAKLLLTLDVEIVSNDEILVQSFLCKKCDTTKVHVYEQWCECNVCLQLISESKTMWSYFKRLGCKYLPFSVSMMQ